MKTRTLKIAGMSRQHCVLNVKKELAKVATVKDVQIGSALVEFNPATSDSNLLKKAVADAGCELVHIS
ncbi:MAG: heavy-metal-associated domain-containing protein [Bacteroidetes bacterium]|jgi:copper chaperone CopZ|nr:heavy-metal-associated domain-containing protein [Bacteroidota bacterium]